MMKAFVVKVNISTMYRGEYNRVRSEYLTVDEPQEKVIENINLRLFCEEANIEYLAQGQTNQVGVGTSKCSRGRVGIITSGG